MKVVNLVSVFIREYKGPKQAFSITFRKFTESTNNKAIFRQYNIFYKLIFFFQSVFCSYFNHRKKVNQIKNNVVWTTSRCSALTTGRCSPFQDIFGNQKNLEFCGPNFQTMLFLATMVSLIKRKITLWENRLNF